MPEYNYKLTNMGESSTKLGPCEVCGKHVTEVWHLQEEREYVRPEGKNRSNVADLRGIIIKMKKPFRLF